MKRTIGYRLDIKTTSGDWIEYTSLKKLYPSMDMPLALAEGLTRQGQTWRIVEASNKAKTAASLLRVVRLHEGTNA